MGEGACKDGNEVTRCAACKREFAGFRTSSSCHLDLTLISLLTAFVHYDVLDDTTDIYSQRVYLISTALPDNHDERPTSAPYKNIVTERRPSTILSTLKEFYADIILPN